MSDPYDTLPDLSPSTYEQSAFLLGLHLPTGKAWDAKNMEGTTMKSVIEGSSMEFSRVEQSFNALAEDFYIPSSTETLTLWEESLGIPDGTFNADGTTEQRRDDVLIKFSKMTGTITVQQWQSLANLLGFDIIIYYGDNRIQFPIEFPIPFFSAINSTFIWYVRVYISGTTINPSEDDTDFLKLVGVFNALNPADYLLITDQEIINQQFPV